DYLWPAADEIGRQRLRKTEGGELRLRRRRDGETAVRPCPEQRGETVARDGDLFVERFQFGARRRRACLGLVEFGLGIEAVVDALLCKIERLFANGERALGDLAVAVERSEIGIGGSDGGRKSEARGGCISCGGAGL